MKNMKKQMVDVLRIGKQIIGWDAFSKLCIFKKYNSNFVNKIAET